MRRFVVLGCNHSAASLDEVAGARIPEEILPQTLAKVREALGLKELVYLATCHRTEWYIHYDGELCPGRLTMALAPLLGILTQGRSRFPQVEHCVALQGEKAARHLFRVVSALDSLMVGETQILGQVKSAFRSAEEMKLVGPLLHTLFTQAFRTAKRIRTETTLSRRPVSLVSLAERQIGRHLASDPGPVAVLGSGEMATVALELIRKLDPERRVSIFNRSEERGAALAKRFGATFRPLASLSGAGPEISIAIAATSAKEPLITPEVAGRMAPALLLDLSLPANIAPECAEIDGIELVDQGALREQAEANRQARSVEVSKAEAILEEQLQELAYEVMEHQLSPVARRLVEVFREVARSELQRLYEQEAGRVSGNGHLEAAVERMSQRLVRLPMKGLREVAWMYSADVLNTFLAAVDR